MWKLLNQLVGRRRLVSALLIVAVCGVLDLAFPVPQSVWADQAGDDYAAAVGFYKQSRWGLAEETFKKFLKDYPKHERVPLQLATRVNQVWSMDFVSDSLSNGRRLKYLTVADDFSHECVDIAVDYGISGQYVTRLLDQAALFRGYPQVVRTDNGPEFTSRAFLAWAQSHGIRHILIQPGRPMQNGYIESFNGKFRDEHLNEHWFQTLQQARSALASWRQDYNEIRPHSSLGRIPPAQFAQQHRLAVSDAVSSTIKID